MLKHLTRSAAESPNYASVYYLCVDKSIFIQSGQVKVQKLQRIKSLILLKTHAKSMSRIYFYLKQN